VSELSKRLNNDWTAVLFLLPAIALFGFISAYPTILGIVYSFTDLTGFVKEYAFVGLKNYIRLFKDEVFYLSISHTFFITLVVVFLQNIVAIALAVIVNNPNTRGKSFFRAVFFIPTLLRFIIIGYTWLHITNVHVGLT
jgi:ABC-type sugar transport system permease subunit